MGKLADRLKDAAKNGVYAVADPVTVAAAAREAGLDCLHLELDTVHARPALFDTFARRLRFPDGFGANWDALEDCLTDLSWNPAPGWVLVLSGQAGLAHRRPEDLRTLIEILESAAGEWSAKGRSFFAVLVDPDGALALPALHHPGRR